MRAVRVHQYGGPEVMAVEKNVEIPTPDETQVLVEIKAAGINPVETYMRAGIYHRTAPLPYTPGSDGAGIVKQVGSKVTSVKPGDKVYFLFSTTGSYAQFCLVNEANVLPLGQLGFEQGAAIGIPYYTAARSLYHCAKNKTTKGNSVLVHGASGAVGLASVQIAKALGMVVFGTAGSAAGLKLVLDNGAKEVFNHREDGYKEKLAKATGEKGFDVILEMAADKNLAIDLDLVAKNGIIVIIGCRGNVEINPRICMQKECMVTGVMLPAASKENWQQMHAAIQDGIQSGWVKPHVSRTYTLEEAPQSHDDIINTKAALGKIVFKL